jgi:hypothetical protein
MVMRIVGTARFCVVIVDDDDDDDGPGGGPVGGGGGDVIRTGVAIMADVDVDVDVDVQFDVDDNGGDIGEVDIDGNDGDTDEDDGCSRTGSGPRHGASDKEPGVTNNDGTASETGVSGQSMATSFSSTVVEISVIHGSLCCIHVIGDRRCPRCTSTLVSVLILTVKYTHIQHKYSYINIYLHTHK